MRIFGRERESLRLRKVKASRAVYMNDAGTQEVEITVLTEAGEKLTLQMNPQLVHALVTELSTAYDAICPPLRRSSEYAQWDGMSDFG